MRYQVVPAAPGRGQRRLGPAAIGVARQVPALALADTGRRCWRCRAPGPRCPRRPCSLDLPGDRHGEARAAGACERGRDQAAGFLVVVVGIEIPVVAVVADHDRDARARRASGPSGQLEVATPVVIGRGSPPGSSCWPTNLPSIQTCSMPDAAARRNGGQRFGIGRAGVAAAIPDVAVVEAVGVHRNWAGRRAGRWCRLARRSIACHLLSSKPGSASGDPRPMRQSARAWAGRRRRAGERLRGEQAVADAGRGRDARAVPA